MPKEYRLTAEVAGENLSGAVYPDMLKINPTLAAGRRRSWFRIFATGTTRSSVLRITCFQSGSEVPPPVPAPSTLGDHEAAQAASSRTRPASPSTAQLEQAGNGILNASARRLNRPAGEP